jgi:hypothetical protein
MRTVQEYDLSSEWISVSPGAVCGTMVRDKCISKMSNGDHMANRLWQVEK